MFRKAGNSYVQADVTVAPSAYARRVKICIACGESKARTALDPQANRDRVRRWQLENPEKYHVKQREYVETGQKQVWDRKSYLKRTYGMTLEDYERMFEAQAGVCAICSEARPEERTLHVDHDHETGMIRGLLCFRCNNALGDFDEEYELFQRAADYLDRDEELALLVQERVGALGA
jgi:hypothetical protein